MAAGFERAKQLYEYIASRPDGALVSEIRNATGFLSCNAALLAMLNENGFLVYFETEPDGRWRIHAWKEADRRVYPKKSDEFYFANCLEGKIK